MVDVLRSGLIGGRDGAVAGRRMRQRGNYETATWDVPLGEEMAENALIELVVAMLQTAYACAFYLLRPPRQR